MSQKTCPTVDRAEARGLAEVATRISPECPPASGVLSWDLPGERTPIPAALRCGNRLFYIFGIKEQPLHRRRAAPAWDEPVLGSAGWSLARAFGID